MAMPASATFHYRVQVEEIRHGDSQRWSARAMTLHPSNRCAVDPRRRGLMPAECCAIGARVLADQGDDGERNPGVGSCGIPGVAVPDPKNEGAPRGNNPSLAARSRSAVVSVSQGVHEQASNAICPRGPGLCQMMPARIDWTVLVVGFAWRAWLLPPQIAGARRLPTYRSECRRRVITTHLPSRNDRHRAV